MRKRTIAAIMAAAALAACAVPDGAMKGSSLLSGTAVRRAAPAQALPDQYVVESVDIISEPPGAAIMINGASVGNAPLGAVALRRYWRGQPGAMVLDTVKVEAFPTAAGQCVQGGIYGQNNSKVQSPLRFVMTNCVTYAPPQPTGSK